MYKRAVVSLFALFLLVSLCACQNQNKSGNADTGNKPHINPNEINIAFQNDCDIEIYGIHIECYLADKAISGGAVSRNPEMDIPFDKGDLIYSNVPIPPDGLFTDDYSDFKMEVYVVLENGEIPVTEHWKWDAELGVYYGFILSQASDGCFIITSRDDSIDYTVTPIEEKSDGKSI